MAVTEKAFGFTLANGDERTGRLVVFQITADGALTVKNSADEVIHIFGAAGEMTFRGDPLYTDGIKVTDGGSNTATVFLR